MRVRVIRLLKTQVLSDERSESPRRQICSIGQQVFSEMASRQSNSDIEQTGKHQQPRSLKMEGTAPTILIGHGVSVSGRHQGSRSGYMNPKERLCIYIASL